MGKNFNRQSGLPSTQLPLRICSDGSVRIEYSLRDETGFLFAFLVLLQMIKSFSVTRRGPQPIGAFNAGVHLTVC